MEPAISAPAQRFFELLQQLDCIYEQYARSLGLTYTSLYVLHTIACTEGCTQKELCAQMLLPKQTVHSVVKGFVAQGLVELTVLPQDRRNKSLRLTDRGRAYAAQLLPPIAQAENACMEQFDPSEQKQLLALMERYVQCFSNRLQP